MSSLRAIARALIQRYRARRLVLASGGIVAGATQIAQPHRCSLPRLYPAKRRIEPAGRIVTPGQPHSIRLPERLVLEDAERGIAISIEQKPGPNGSLYCSFAFRQACQCDSAAIHWSAPVLLQLGVN